MITLTLPAWTPPQAIWFFLAGLAGVLAHYISARGRGEIKCNLITYLFHDHPGYTIATLMSLVAATFAAQAVGLEDMKLTMLVGSGFTAGWAIDSGVAPGHDDDDHHHDHDDHSGDCNR